MNVQTDKKIPEISVIMGVYNQKDRQMLQDAVKSILNQTFSDFEFLIYNDGSDKESSNYIREVAELDSRIVLIEASENKGLAFALNTCIEQARGKYIARMDSDDISKPERFMRQYLFLEEHPEYEWCGTNTELIDENGVWGIRKMPECPTEKDYLKFSPYIHPSVMYRASLFEKEKKYLVSSDTLRCEDYEIFMRLHSKGYRGYNIQQEIFCYREEPMSFKKRKFKYRINEAKIRYRNFKKMQILFPTGWIYIARPIIAAFVPIKAIMLFKREKLEYKNEPRESTNSVLQRKISS